MNTDDYQNILTEIDCKIKAEQRKLSFAEAHGYKRFIDVTRGVIVGLKEAKVAVMESWIPGDTKGLGDRIK